MFLKVFSSEGWRSLIRKGWISETVIIIVERTIRPSDAGLSTASHLNKCSDRRIEVSQLLGNSDWWLSDRPINQQTDMRAHRKVAPKIDDQFPMLTPTTECRIKNETASNRVLIQIYNWLIMIKYSSWHEDRKCFV